jgi:hypothetical protein
MNGGALQRPQHSDSSGAKSGSGVAPKAGREVDRIVGAQPKSEIARRLERVMA